MDILLDTTMDRHLDTAEDIANFLDGKFKFFKFRFGMNGIFGLVPVVGDVITAFLSLYLVWIGIQMLANIMTNFFIGLLPVVGDFVDFFHKANLKNLKILRQYAKGHVIEGRVVA
jgi:hypothetical protein